MKLTPQQRRALGGRMFAALREDDPAAISAIVADDRRVLEFGEWLHVAARDGREKAAKRLVELGIPLDVTDENGEMPIHLAALYGHTAIVQWMLAAGVSVNLKTKTSATPLIKAAQMGQTELVKALLSAGADSSVRTTGTTKVTAVEAAQFGGHVETVAVLAKSGPAPAEDLDALIATDPYETAVRSFIEEVLGEPRDGVIAPVVAHDHPVGAIVIDAHRGHDVIYCCTLGLAMSPARFTADDGSHHPIELITRMESSPGDKKAFRIEAQCLLAAAKRLTDGPAVTDGTQMELALPKTTTVKATFTRPVPSTIQTTDGVVMWVTMKVK